MRLSPVSLVLVCLAFTLLISGCGGASPERRARQTRTALLGTSTPIPPPPTSIGFDQDRAALLTAEAFLPVVPPPIVIGTVSATPGPMTQQALTEAMIEAAMAKAEARACVGSDRCYALPSDIESARARCTPSGQCRVGVIVGRGGRERFDVWLEVTTRLVKLIRQAGA